MYIKANYYLIRIVVLFKSDPDASPHFGPFHRLIDKKFNDQIMDDFCFSCQQFFSIPCRM